MHIIYWDPYTVARCKPLTKDHLLLKTAFAGTKGWSVVTGFTVDAFAYTGLYHCVTFQSNLAFSNRFEVHSVS